MSLTQQHPSHQNIRARIISYNHIEWDSAHQARDSTGQNMKIIDKETGLVFHMNFMKQKCW